MIYLKIKGDRTLTFIADRFFCILFQEYISKDSQLVTTEYPSLNILSCQRKTVGGIRLKLKYCFAYDHVRHEVNETVSRDSLKALTHLQGTVFLRDMLSSGNPSEI